LITSYFRHKGWEGKTQEGREQKRNWWGLGYWRRKRDRIIAAKVRTARCTVRRWREEQEEGEKKDLIECQKKKVEKKAQERGQCQNETEKKGCEAKREGKSSLYRRDRIHGTQKRDYQEDLGGENEGKKKKKQVKTYIHSRGE